MAGHVSVHGLALHIFVAMHENVAWLAVIVSVPDVCELPVSV